ncbi:ImmA/IrrE family metallo-endopeptidase [Kribbella sp. NPDC051137]|uniref:ImmA/IrrE family metallo-endopeptidase n=1 Tax=Kribbella sp. NPDC051137 TaxID=3155045 RepID=UPI003424FB4D
MDWKLAHRIAGMAANQAHRDLEIDRTTYVPVYRALGTAGLIGMAKSMPRLFGVYLSAADDGPAVLLNSGLDITGQRHTAAHELGHHRLHHDTAADDELDRSITWGDGTWPDHEKVAEAFAAWFLMPQPAVLAATQRVAGERSLQPTHAYLIGRALGTSYAGTVRQLLNLRLISRAAASQWASIPPSKLKRELTGGRPVAGTAHVHVILPSTVDEVFHVDVGDVLVLYIPDAHFGSSPELTPWTESGKAGYAPAVAVTDELTSTSTVTLHTSTSHEPLALRLARESCRSGIDDIWP